MYDGGMAGLTYWSPNVKLRDPRWGCGHETPGEDPVVAGRHASILRLMILIIGRGMDHFHFNAQDIEDTFDLPFRMCVKEGNEASVMCSYDQHTQDAVNKGLLSEADVNGSCPPSCHPRNCAPQERWFYFAPLSMLSPFRTMVVIGPNSNVTITMIGNYPSIACRYTNKQFGSALDAARRADETVLVMSLNQFIEAETVDRIGSLLPGHPSKAKLVAPISCSELQTQWTVLGLGGFPWAIIIFTLAMSNTPAISLRAQTLKIMKT
ncbi:hypothetical protein K1719_024942 [Acacia pycnantha]|nr:hypothetical protein K1719_024942 [Acacia pycnantha]